MPVAEHFSALTAVNGKIVSSLSFAPMPTKEQHMRKLRPHHLTPCLLSVGLFCSPAILAGENFSDLFTGAKPILDLRYRYEHIDQTTR